MPRRQSPKALGMFRSDGAKLVPLDVRPVERETVLQGWAELAPTIVGEPLLIIGAKVKSPLAGEPDLLAMDPRGILHVIELKRGPRTFDVVAQIVRYEAWVSRLSRKKVRDLFARYRPGVSLETAFRDAFGRPLPDGAGTKRVLTIVAEQLDGPTEDQISAMRNRGHQIGFVQFTRYVDAESEYVVFTRRVEHALDSDKRLKTMQKRADRRLGLKLTEFRSLLSELREAIQMLRRGTALATEPSASLVDGVDSDIAHFWLEHRWRWQWEFLPFSFLKQLYAHWSRREAAKGHRVAKHDDVTRFGKKLREVVEAYGGWEYRQRCPRTSLSDSEPLTELIPAWIEPAPDAVTIGYTRAGTTW
ncbi:hypothetical protein M0722_16225 [Microbacterium sp. KSW4-16]|uniref:hypothetical protein n=1 Tax=Microbacterium aurugineum TaxID=2851642 RepID=UPI0020BEACC4|nr:hypothetical protein [Microbacterium aurugineum]MCK8468743.1 hypothetical protein [Microbacterium aurugineum]